MEEEVHLEYTYQTIVDILGMVQGTILGVLLLVVHRNNYKSTFFLGVFLLLFSFHSLPAILEKMNVYKLYTNLYRLPLDFIWLLFPVFYLYSQQISVFSKHKIKYWILIPGIFYFLFQLTLFFFPYTTKLKMVNWYEIISWTGFFYGWLIAIWNFTILQHHKVIVRNHFSMIEHKELLWARTFLIFTVTTSMIYILQFYFMPENVYSQIFFSLFNLTIIYWVAYHGLLQQNVISVLSNDWSLSSVQTKNEALGVPHQELTELMGRIDKYMRDSQSFANVELTIIDVAKELKAHPKRISAAINSVTKQNFNAYVNQYRINKAIALLKSHDDSNLSIEGMGNEVGFNSKSAFYAAFRKSTGTTPSKYKESLQV